MRFFFRHRNQAVSTTAGIKRIAHEPFVQSRSHSSSRRTCLLRISQLLYRPRRRFFSRQDDVRYRHSRGKRILTLKMKIDSAVKAVTGSQGVLFYDDAV